MTQPMFAGKVVLVTGGAGGIGRATALAFGRAGATVAVSDRAIDGGEQTVNLIREAGGIASFIKADVTVAAEVESLVAYVVQAHGRLDCAFNNAGIEEESQPTALCEEAQFDRIIDEIVADRKNDFGRPPIEF